LLYEEQLRNIIEGYKITAGQETPLDFESTLTIPVRPRRQSKKSRASSDAASIPEVMRVVHGMFPAGSERGTFANWIAVHNIVKGGEGCQHAHSD
jgi:hypothetical protein